MSDLKSQLTAMRQFMVKSGPFPRLMSERHKACPSCLTRKKTNFQVFSNTQRKKKALKGHYKQVPTVMG